MANRQIKYGISFEINNSNLQAVQAELQKIYSMTTKDLQLIDVNATKADLESIKNEASKLGKALEDSFNPKLNTINITKFNDSLKSSSTNIQTIGNKLKKYDDRPEVKYFMDNFVPSFGLTLDEISRK